MTLLEQAKSVREAQSCCENPNIGVSYGLAGGGIGVYEYCANCNKIISKTQDDL